MSNELTSQHVSIVIALVALRRTDVPGICRFAGCAAKPVIELIRSGLLNEVAEVTGDLDTPQHVSLDIRPEANDKMVQIVERLGLLMYSIMLPPELPVVDDNLNLARDFLREGKVSDAKFWLESTQCVLDDHRTHVERFYRHGLGMLHDGKREAAETALSEMQAQVNALTRLVEILRP